MDVKVGLYEESWEPKNWCFWTVVLEKTLESPLDCKEIQPVHSKEDQPWVCSLVGLMLKLKLQYFGHLMQRVDSLDDWCWEGLRAGEEGDNRGWDGWMASPTRWTRVWVNSRSWWWTGRPGVLQSLGSQKVGHDWATELNWTEHLRLLLFFIQLCLLRLAMCGVLYDKNSILFICPIKDTWINDHIGLIFFDKGKVLF